MWFLLYNWLAYKLQCMLIKKGEVIRQLQSEIEDVLLDNSRKLLGMHFVELMNSRDITERFIRHQNAKIRRGALSLLAGFWEPNPEMENEYLRIAMCDSDLAVRSEALSCLTSMYVGSKNKDISKRLSRIIINESYPIDLRGAAYVDLTTVQGIAISKKLLIQFARYKDSLPPDLDWSMVNSFLE